MDSPMDDVASVIDTDLDKHSELGDYVTWNTTANPDKVGALVAEWPVVGPYTNLDASSPYDWLPFETTIVPNGDLDKYDCPMPPALVAFKIADDGLGYFKAVDKGDVYYKIVDPDIGEIGDEGIAYTNPFYALCIPANPWLNSVSFVNDGRYLWNTWDDDDGWYDLWTFVDWNIDCTMVKVYSDNHGEAMVWLNGDLGYDLSGTANWTDGVDSGTVTGWTKWTEKVSQGADVTVGSTVVQARALYPYFEVDKPVYSNTVSKTWDWGEEKLVDIYQLGSLANPPLEDDFTHKLIIVWLKDRDGLAAEGLTLRWTLLGDGVLLDGTEAGGVNEFDDVMPMTVIDDTHATSVSWLADNDTYGKWWVAAQHNGTCDGYAMAAIELLGSDAQVGVDVAIGYAEGTLIHPENNIDLTKPGFLDPPLKAGLNTGKYGGPSLPITDAITSIANNLVAIWWQDISGGWHCYQPGAPAWANDLSVLNSGDTYCVYVSADCDWLLF
jgi:predicted heme/steroid binding protein